MREIEVVLAGQRYTVRRMPAMRAVSWRKCAQGLLERFPSLVDAYNAETENVMASGLEMMKGANGIVEALIEVVISADPALEADREHILANGYEEEFMEGFQSLLMLNSPLSDLAKA
jgi:hypothetical protein